MYDNLLFSFLCLLFLYSNLIKKEFVTHYGKIRQNPNQQKFLAKKGFCGNGNREKKNSLFFIFYLNYIRKIKIRNSVCLPNLKNSIFFFDRDFLIENLIKNQKYK